MISAAPKRSGFSIIFLVGLIAVIFLAVLATLHPNVFKTPLSSTAAPTTTDNNAPEPLRYTNPKNGGTLTQTGIFKETNQQRQQNNLPPLVENTLLNTAAAKKLQDMFDKQYFEHESPGGVGPAQLVSSVGYHYVRIGENLALGGFANDTDLVQAWMNSPGHRANILRPNVTEIGIAAKLGTFEGRQVWIAVQEFGLPASVCPSPDAKAQQTFTINKQTVADMSETLAAEKTELEQQQNKLNNLQKEINLLLNDGNADITKGNDIFKQTDEKTLAQPNWDSGQQLQNQAAQKQASYDQQRKSTIQLQDAYNKKIAEYNALQDSLKNTVTQINTEITTYNKCLQK